MKLVKTIYVVIALGLVFSSAVIARIGDGYLKTCRQCRVMSIHHQRYLNCSCLDRNQFPRNTSIVLTRRCQRIENIDGQLKCTRFIKPRPIAPPHHRMVRLVDISAGPILNNADAQQKCYSVCSAHDRASWTGQWHTVREGVNSVCECRLPQRHRHYLIDLQAGPIWNNINAHQVCPGVCMRQPRGHWTGQWHTVKAGVASVCECDVIR